MGYLSVGYYTVCFSPVFSLFVYIFAFMLMVGKGYGWLFPTIVRTEVHTLIIGMQVCGIGLYFVGYKKEKTESKQVPFVEFSSIFLILWGSLVSWFAIGCYYHELIPWSMLPGVRELTLWDHLEFVTWALKGLLWIASGLTFIATSYIQKGVKPKLEELGRSSARALGVPSNF